ncbi:MAG TPA: ribonuclease D, partial [Chromatiales bacterium]|nr:ribonuclease D [Chromatiales bacterium]
MHEEIHDGDHQTNRERPGQRARQNMPVDCKRPQNDCKNECAGYGRARLHITEHPAPQTERQRHQAKQRTRTEDRGQGLSVTCPLAGECEQQPQADDQQTEVVDHHHERLLPDAEHDECRQELNQQIHNGCQAKQKAGSRQVLRPHLPHSDRDKRPNQFDHDGPDEKIPPIMAGLSHDPLHFVFMPALTPSTVISGMPEADALLSGLQTSPVVAVDTEFNRTNTYRPQLCLVQLASTDRLGLIDMLADLDTEPLRRLLANSDGLKLFHAASQDMEVLQLSLGTLPNRIFDTQIAAGLLGYPAQMGYAKLVAELLDVELDKGATRTDWSRRPLSDTQLKYAAADVTWLLQVYEILRGKLQEAGRLAWAEEDSARLLDPSRYVVDPEQAWQRLPGIAYLPVDAQHRARALAKWR